MKILITGARGFIGKHLMAALENRKDVQVLEFNRDTDFALLEDYCREADFIYHLAGVNRPKKEEEYMEGNYGLTKRLTDSLIKARNPCRILYTSSIQAGRYSPKENIMESPMENIIENPGENVVESPGENITESPRENITESPMGNIVESPRENIIEGSGENTTDNPYGYSKKAAEECLLCYGRENGAKVFLYRLPNVFGKWSRPDYNSVVATFCHNIARDLPITINNPQRLLKLAYIDDVIGEFLRVLDQGENGSGGYGEIPATYDISLETLAKLLYTFRDSRETKLVPDLLEGFTRKLYSTYLSFLPEEGLSYPLKMNQDQRGSFTEFLKSGSFGQISVNVIKPGIQKGNHWHHTKTEKFLVVKGEGVIRLRNIHSHKILQYFVTGDRLEVIDIPPGYTHNIENLGNTDMITIIWANESYDPLNPDTYFMEV